MQISLRNSGGNPLDCFHPVLLPAGLLVISRLQSLQRNIGGSSIMFAESRLPMVRVSGILLGLGLWFTQMASAPADVPTGVDRGKVIGQPLALVVEPANVTLSGPRSVQQVIVTGKYADGTVRDLTSFVTFSSETPNIIAAEENLYLRPKQNGTTTLVIQ